MGMEHLMSVMNPSSGYILQRGFERRGDGTMEEMKELQKQRTERMMEDYQNTESRDGAIRCPIPCKSSRPYREYDFKAAQDLSDFIVSKVVFGVAFKCRLLLHTSWDLRQFVQATPLSTTDSSVLGKYKALISHSAFLYQPRATALATTQGEGLLQRIEATFISFMTSL